MDWWSRPRNITTVCRAYLKMPSIGPRDLRCIQFSKTNRSSYCPVLHPRSVAHALMHRCARRSARAWRGCFQGPSSSLPMRATRSHPGRSPTRPPWADWKQQVGTWSNTSGALKRQIAQPPAPVQVQARVSQRGFNERSRRKSPDIFDGCNSESRPRYQFCEFLPISQILTGAGTIQVPLALSTTLLVSHPRKSVDADVLLRSCGTSTLL
jgi:hypothetical protein